MLLKALDKLISTFDVKLIESLLRHCHLIIFTNLPGLCNILP